MGDCTKNSAVTNGYVTDMVGDAMMEDMKRVYGLIDNDEVIKSYLYEIACNIVMALSNKHTRNSRF